MGDPEGLTCAQLRKEGGPVGREGPPAPSNQVPKEPPQCPEQAASMGTLGMNPGCSVSCPPPADSRGFPGLPGTAQRPQDAHAQPRLRHRKSVFPPLL